MAQASVVTVTAGKHAFNPVIAALLLPVKVGRKLYSLRDPAVAAEQRVA